MHTGLVHAYDTALGRDADASARTKRELRAVHWVFRALLCRYRCKTCAASRDEYCTCMLLHIIRARVSRSADKRAHAPPRPVHQLLCPRRCEGIGCRNLALRMSLAKGSVEKYSLTMPVDSTSARLYVLWEHSTGGECMCYGERSGCLCRGKHHAQLCWLARGRAEPACMDARADRPPLHALMMHRGTHVLRYMSTTYARDYSRVKAAVVCDEVVSPRCPFVAACARRC